jgi:hypothetical protein
VNLLRRLRARRLVRLEAEIDAAFAESWAVIVEQRSKDNAAHDLLEEQARSIR